MQSRLENNAEGWLVSNLQILENHYSVVKNQGLAEITNLDLTEEEKNRAIEVGRQEETPIQPQQQAKQPEQEEVPEQEIPPQETQHSYTSEGLQRWVNQQPLSEQQMIHSEQQIINPSRGNHLVGINDRKGNPSLVKNAISRACSAARSTFPNALIGIQTINFAQNLPPKEKQIIRVMNEHMRGLGEKIAALPVSLFHTEKDLIHWTNTTAQDIWGRWKEFFHRAEVGRLWAELNDDTQAPAQTPSENAVLNLSKKIRLNKDQKELLCKGLIFIPTHLQPNWDKLETGRALTEYYRWLKLLAFFQEEAEGGMHEPEKRFRFNSDWEPQGDQVPGEVWGLIEQDQKILMGTAGQERGGRDNLSLKEKIALQALRQNREIIIKPADKGSSIVVMDREQYQREALRQLRNTDFYVELTEPLYKQTESQIVEILENIRVEKHLTKQQVEYIKGRGEPRPRRFYLLPKIHIARTTWTLGDVLPGRIIVSDCGSESYGVAEWLDYHLTPLVNKHPSHIKDTCDFLDKIRQVRIPIGASLFSMDVTSLYTEIEIDRGLQAVTRCLSENPRQGRPDQAILELLGISLRQNDFEFDGKWYLQVKGTAMGKRFAPAYANIYMAEWERTLQEQGGQWPFCYWRYVDDIWGVWDGTEQEFREWANILNTHHPSIKLTATYHKHIFRGIIKGQLTRYQRICTQTQDEIQARTELFRALKQRCYSRGMLRKVQREVQTRKPVHGQQFQPRLLPLVIRHSATNQNLASKIRKKIIDSTLGQDLGERSRMVVAYTRGKNLGDLLVHSKFTNKQQHKIQGRRALVRSGQTRVYSVEGGSKIRKNGIYLIFCKKNAASNM
ncbi:hypothetical protein IRJ41_018224 [Triplophysa rosa]|uniref:Reverse transcriptase domain-containing protein n=1 Tax=Triplophysa rosa TaxID=992332 RepID=A0A9W7T530_TRIRA|nr:hypothetical protein IRJ41_018224 [Triplophysa rosa]